MQKRLINNRIHKINQNQQKVYCKTQIKKMAEIYLAIWKKISREKLIMKKKNIFNAKNSNGKKKWNKKNKYKKRKLRKKVTNREHLHFK